MLEKRRNIKKRINKEVYSEINKETENDLTFKKA